MRTACLLVIFGLAAGCHSSTSSNGDGGVGDGGDLGVAGDMAPAIDIGASVLQLHNHANRDGVFVEPAFTAAAVATMHRDSAFNGAYASAGANGVAYGAPLFIDNGGTGDVVLVALESNDVIAYDAVSGAVKWHTPPSVLGQAAPGADFSCGDIDPSGITGTPVVDLGTRAMFLQTDYVKNGAAHHAIHSLSIDDGSERAGWPIDLDDIIPGFADKQQGQRGALLVLGDHVYVPFGGRAGDCTPYRGYVVALPLSAPTAASALVFATKASDAAGNGAAGGIWSPEGVSSDGTSIFFNTGNAQGTYPTDWKMSYTEGVFRLPPSLAFDPADTTRWFAPTDFHALDTSDTDISGSGVLLVDAPGITPPHLAAVLGKDKKLYLLDATNLGGMSPNDGLYNGVVAGSEIINSPSWYTTAKGTWVAFKAACAAGGQPTLNAVQLAAGPTMGSTWCANVPGGGSPIVTTTGGGNNTVVWFVSTEGEGITPDYKLHGFDGDTGAALVATEAMTSVRRFVSPMVAKGRVYVAGDDRLYAFKP